MMLTLGEARDALRLDGDDNDTQILALVEAIPPYLQHTTGYVACAGDYSPVARTVARFILQLWYFGDNPDAGRQSHISRTERVIDCLLKALSAERELQ